MYYVAALLHSITRRCGHWNMRHRSLIKCLEIPIQISSQKKLGHQSKPTSRSNGRIPMTESTTVSTAQSSRKPLWNKGKLIGQKPPLKPKHVWAIRTRLQMAGRVRESGSVQPRHRQQAARLRCREAHGSRRGAVGGDEGARDDPATEDGPPSPVRAHRTDPSGGGGLDQAHGQERPRLPLQRSRLVVAALDDPPVLSPRGRMAREHRPRSWSLRHALPTAYQGRSNLPAHRQS